MAKATGKVKRIEEKMPEMPGMKFECSKTLKYEAIKMVSP